MMSIILSVGRDHLLMPLRTMVLHRAGYVVREAYAGDEALRLLSSGKFDLLLICHTIPEPEQRELIAAVRRALPGLPIACMNSNEHPIQEHCSAVDNMAPAFLTDLSEVLHKTVSSS